MLWSLATVVVATWLLRMGLILEGPGVLAMELALFSHAFLMVVLVHHVRQVSPAGLALAGTTWLIGSGLVVVSTGARSTAETGVLLVGWTALELYAGAVLLRMAADTTGVQRLRARFAAAGSGALVLIICSGVYAEQYPAHAEALAGVSNLLGLLAGVLWTMGFLPPRDLLHWAQLVELHELLLEGEGAPGVRKVARLERRFPQAASRMLGGATVALSWSDPRHGFLHWEPDWELEDSETNALVALAASGGWAGAASDVMLPALAARARELGARQIFVVPVELGGVLEGIWVAWAPLPLLFPNDQLALLRLMGEHVAGARQRTRLEQEWTELIGARRERRERERRRRVGEQGAVVELHASLRAQLGRVRGFGELLTTTGPLSARQESHLAELLEGAQAMGQHLQLLEAYVALEVEPAPRSAPISLARQLERVVEAWLERAPEAPITCECEDPSLRVELGAGELEVILGVLIQRALEESRPGDPVSIRVRVRDERWAEVTVRDLGVGFAPGELLDAFPELSGFTARGAAGGERHRIQLAVVRGIVERRGGSVFVDSDWGEGASLGFRVPRVVSNDHGFRVIEGTGGLSA
ncbi:MAG: HAMP domain-containing histidine kinase [Alphaproteobacteria bacterium]|nr:HAMP domain-containing histidine kinase [Alphaproteobacteria bacterium]